MAQSGYAEIRTEGDSLILGRKKITPIFKSRQERALASLCHGSLAYCCPLSKRCPERDRALEVLGLTPRDYERMKMRAHHDFLEMSKGLPPSEDVWTYDQSPRRVANTPAVDTGFGGDDYRMDFDRLEQSFRHSKGHISTPETDWGTRGSKGASFAGTRRDPTQSQMGSSSILDALHPIENVESDRGGSSTASSACSLGSENIEGLGALFRQGELSPFSDDTKARVNGQRQGFCFSCGRTIPLETRRCPYCGAIQ